MKLKFSIILVTLSFLMVFANTVSAAPPQTSVGLYGTGKTSANAELAAGATDSHWEWSLDGGTNWAPAVTNSTNFGIQSATNPTPGANFLQNARTTFTVQPCAVGSVTINVNGDIANGWISAATRFGKVYMDGSEIIADTTPGHNWQPSGPSTGPYATATWNVTPGTHTLEWVHNPGLGGDRVDWTFLNVDVTYNATCPPVLTNDTADTDNETAVNIDVQDNDTDPDNDTLTITSVDGQAITSGGTVTLSNGSGTVTLNANGTLTFTPADGYIGTSNFAYITSDGIATDEATVSVEVSDATIYCPAPYNSPAQALTAAGDCDGDGITNQAEGYDPDEDGDPNSGTSPVDTDGDGTPDYLDLDSDNDGILDEIEKGTTSDASTNPVDTDNDGIPDYRDLDSDGDGIFDVVESGLPNPNQLDSNNDGKIDGPVNQYGLPTSVVRPGSPSSVISYTLVDSDGDGVSDYLDLDSDNDGILDELEGAEDTDGDGVGNWRDLDSDGDGIFDLIESGIPNAKSLDANNDGRIDGKVNQFGIPLAIVDPTNPRQTIGYTLLDSDNDGTPDYLEAGDLAVTGTNSTTYALLSTALLTSSLLFAAGSKVAQRKFFK